MPCAKHVSVFLQASLVRYSCMCADLCVVIMVSAGLLKFLLMFIAEPVYLSYTPRELDSECDHIWVCVYTSYMIPPAAYSFVFMPVLPTLLKISLKLAHLLLHPLLDSLPPLWIAPPCHEMHFTPAAHSTWRANQLPAEPKQGYSQWAHLAVQYANEV